jgi:hypothetical protein
VPVDRGRQVSAGREVLVERAGADGNALGDRVEGGVGKSVVGGLEDGRAARQRRGALVGGARRGGLPATEAEVSPYVVRRRGSRVRRGTPAPDRPGRSPGRGEYPGGRGGRGRGVGSRSVDRLPTSGAGTPP